MAVFLVSVITVICACPDFNAVSIPLSFTETISGAEDDHSQLSVEFNGDITAVICIFCPFSIAKKLCSNATFTDGTSFTVTEHFVLILPDSTVINAFPLRIPRTFPLESTMAIFLFDDFQITLSVLFSGEICAVKRLVFPLYSVSFDLLSFIFFTGISFTVIRQVVFFFPEDTVIVAFPFDFAVTVPSEDTTATFLSDDFQTTLSVEEDGCKVTFNLYFLFLYKVLFFTFKCISFVCTVFTVT